MGSLLHANDELVHALMAYEQLDHSIEADSDSDDELAEQAHRYRSKCLKYETRFIITNPSLNRILNFKLQ